MPSQASWIPKSRTNALVQTDPAVQHTDFILNIGPMTAWNSCQCEMRASLATSGNRATAVLSPSARGMQRQYCTMKCERVGKIKRDRKPLKASMPQEQLTTCQPCCRRSWPHPAGRTKTYEKGRQTASQAQYFMSQLEAVAPPLQLRARLDVIGSQLLAESRHGTVAVGHLSGQHLAQVCKV